MHRSQTEMIKVMIKMRTFRMNVRIVYPRNLRVKKIN